MPGGVCRAAFDKQVLDDVLQQRRVRVDPQPVGDLDRRRVLLEQRREPTEHRVDAGTEIDRLRRGTIRPRSSAEVSTSERTITASRSAFSSMRRSRSARRAGSRSSHRRSRVCPSPSITVIGVRSSWRHRRHEVVRALVETTQLAPPWPRPRRTARARRSAMPASSASSSIASTWQGGEPELATGREEHRGQLAVDADGHRDGAPRGRPSPAARPGGTGTRARPPDRPVRRAMFDQASSPETRNGGS